MSIHISLGIYLVVKLPIICEFCIIACRHTMLLQWCHTLCDPMDCSPPGSSVHGILKARILEWVAMPFSNWATREAHKYMLSYTVSILLPSDMNAFALKENKLKALFHSAMFTTDLVYIVSIHTKSLYNFHMSCRLCQTNLYG